MHQGGTGHRNALVHRASRPSHLSRRDDNVPHRRRPDHAPNHPVHVTLRVRHDVPRLRHRKLYAALRAGFRGGRDRFGFRLIHYSVRSKHIQLICEAEDRRALTRGMQGLNIRLAKRLNRAMGRRGPVFADRYSARDVKTPRETRLALRRVLVYHARHRVSAAGPDGYSSGVAFDGWKYPVRDMRLLGSADATTVVPPRTWLLTVGWRVFGGPLWWVVHRRRPPDVFDTWETCVADLAAS